MNTGLDARRKFFIATYAAYLKADQAWTDALRIASDLVPNVVGHGYWRIGAPHSRLRKLYLERDRALHRMMIARAKLNSARQRQSARKLQSVVLLAKV
jgi:hypothetical protein